MFFMDSEGDTIQQAETSTERQTCTQSVFFFILVHCTTTAKTLTSHTNFLHIKLLSVTKTEAVSFIFLAICGGVLISHVTIKI